MPVGKPKPGALREALARRRVPTPSLTAATNASAVDCVLVNAPLGLEGILAPGEPELLEELLELEELLVLEVVLVLEELLLEELVAAVVESLPPPQAAKKLALTKAAISKSLLRMFFDPINKFVYCQTRDEKLATNVRLKLNYLI
jgi:hypothetical protein